MQPIYFSDEQRNQAGQTWADVTREWLIHWLKWHNACADRSVCVCVLHLRAQVELRIQWEEDYSLFHPLNLNSDDLQNVQKNTNISWPLWVLMTLLSLCSMQCDVACNSSNRLQFCWSLLNSCILTNISICLEKEPKLQRRNERLQLDDIKVRERTPMCSLQGPSWMDQAWNMSAHCSK